MIGLIIVTVIITLLEAFRVAIFVLRKDVTVFRKISEIFILIIMIILEYCILVLNINYAVYISLVLCCYVLLCFVYEYLFKNEHISVLSVKNGIDMADTGIMFFDNFGSIILINNLFYGVLKELDITSDYIDNLIRKCFKKLDNDYLLKYGNKIYMLKVNDKEAVLLDITELYSLQKEEELQNKIIKENNNKLLLAIRNMEKLEREKNLLKLKNEYHDIIGYRLALFNKYLQQDNRNIKDALFLLDSIYEDFNSNLNGWEKLNNLIKMYCIIGININLVGTLPLEEDKAIVFFEIIREATTNAIIHADSKNINIVITKYSDYMEMVITNDGKKPSSVIFENEGIKGMRKKIMEIDGSLKIITDNDFVLVVKV